MRFKIEVFVLQSGPPDGGGPIPAQAPEPHEGQVQLVQGFPPKQSGCPGSRCTGSTRRTWNHQNLVRQQELVAVAPNQQVFKRSFSRSVQD